MTRELLKLLQQWLRSLLRSERNRRHAPLWVAILTIAVFGIGQLLKEHNAPLPGGGTEMTCRVNEVIDGDTIVASCDSGKLHVRVFGIDAPEMGQKRWGKQSRDLLRMLTPASVRLRVVDTDRYGRTVARLYAGDEDLGLKMVRLGGAVVYSQYNDAPDYQQAQAEARQEKRGVWAKPGAQQRPWEWRKLNPR